MLICFSLHSCCLWAEIFLKLFFDPFAPRGNMLVRFREKFNLFAKILTFFVTADMKNIPICPEAKLNCFSLQSCCIELKSAGDSPVTPLPLMGTLGAFSWRLIVLPKCEILVIFFIAKCSELDGRVQKQNNVFSLQYCCIELKSAGDSPVTPLPLMGAFGAFSWRLIFWPKCEIFVIFFIGKRLELERLGSKS